MNLESIKTEAHERKLNKGDPILQPSGYKATVLTLQPRTTIATNALMLMT